MAKLTKSVVDAIEPRDRQFTVWCTELKGFGVFVQPTGTKTYFIDFRTRQGQRRRMTLGRHGPLTVEQARKRALIELGRVAVGEDPANERDILRQSMTMAQLCNEYLAALDKGLILGKGNRPKKQSTIYTDRGRIQRHIVPLLGKIRICDLAKSDVSRFLKDVASGKTAMVEKTRQRGKSIVRGGLGTAARTTGLLSGILSYAVELGLLEANPAHGVKRPASQRRTRRLSAEEYGRLGVSLDHALRQGEAPQLTQAIWLLALTGCRAGEVLKLTWSEVDRAGQCFRLADSKEGASIRPIGKPVIDLLASIDNASCQGRVISPVRAGMVFGGLPKGWRRIAQRAGLVDATPHTLRHSFASVAADLGYSELTIAALLGHASGSITSRYIHQVDSVLIAAADKVAGAILDMMATDRMIRPDPLTMDRGNESRPTQTYSDYGRSGGSLVG